MLSRLGSQGLGEVEPTDAWSTVPFHHPRPLLGKEFLAMSGACEGDIFRAFICLWGGAPECEPV